MIRDREQPLNPPGIDAPDRKIKRQYIPMRFYKYVEVNNESFSVYAEVSACGKHDEDLEVSNYAQLALWRCDEKYTVFSPFLDSYISRTGPTWRELIEREICRQASELPGTAWKVEYEGG